MTKEVKVYRHIESGELSYVYKREWYPFEHLSPNPKVVRDIQDYPDRYLGYPKRDAEFFYGKATLILTIRFKGEQ